MTETGERKLVIENPIIAPTPVLGFALFDRIAFSAATWDRCNGSASCDIDSEKWRIRDLG